MSTVKDHMIEFLLEITREMREKIQKLELKLIETERKYVMAEAMINYKTSQRTKNFISYPDDEDIVDSLLQRNPSPVVNNSDEIWN